MPPSEVFLVIVSITADFRTAKRLSFFLALWTGETFLSGLVWAEQPVCDAPRDEHAWLSQGLVRAEFSVYRLH